MREQTNSVDDILRRCHVNTNNEDDCFVGIKIDETGARFYFPIGFQLSHEEKSLQSDIRCLIKILSAFTKSGYQVYAKYATHRTHTIFPIFAYLTILNDYVNTGEYYKEHIIRYTTNTKGDISWRKTIRKQRPFIQKNGSIAFTRMSVRTHRLDEENLITYIHRYCVHQAFKNFGWLFTTFVPRSPGPKPNINTSINLLNRKIVTTNNDREQLLFTAMKSILTFIDNRATNEQAFFGVDSFAHVWEFMIDSAFGIKDKRRFFPHAKWNLLYGNTRTTPALQPDTIMFLNNKYYVIDAKYYRYGCSFNPMHLPNTADIDKQITYADYIYTNSKRLIGSQLATESLYNIFIIPFNAANHQFHGRKSKLTGSINITENIKKVAEATADWLDNPKPFQRVQAVVIDTKFLMQNYNTMTDKFKQQLVTAIGQ